MSIKLLRITTFPISLKVLLKGQHRFINQNGFEVLGVSSGGKVLQEVHNDEGIQVVEIEMTRTFSPFKDLQSLWLFFKLCKKEKPLIVHSHTPKAGIVGMLGSWLANVPIRLHTVAGMPLMEASGTKRMVLDWVEKVTYSCANSVYPNSKGLYDFILNNRYTSSKKLKVIANGSSNGIDTVYFSTDQISEKAKEDIKCELGINPGDFVFIFVGRLVGDKGINELITAFSILNKNVPKSKLLLVGPFEHDLDPLYPSTTDSIRENKNILSVGFQKDVRPYLAISNALVFPSYREGFPNVVMQAGAMGLPSIVTNINGCNEIIIDKVNGLIIPPKNEKALYDAMKHFLHNPDELNRMAGNSRQLIVKRYEQQKVWEAILEEYRHHISEYEKSK